MPSSRDRQAAGLALRSALARLLREVSRALKTFDRDQSAKAHFIRTRVKRLQSLSRLAPKGASWRRNFLPPCRRLKDVFSEMRDADVTQAVAGQYAPGEACHLRAVMRPDILRAAQLAEFASGVLSDYTRWETMDWKSIADRSVGTYRAARRHWKRARRAKASDAAFHRWRRRVKRLLYQCEYLGGCARLARLTGHVRRLGGMLGDIQDLRVAEEWLARRTGGVSADLPRRKMALRRRALACGEKLFAARPCEFRKMLD